MEETTLTKQEMFNRAWIGLRSQTFERAAQPNGYCEYKMENGKRCAWGWVDQEHAERIRGDVYDGNRAGVGLLANLNPEDLLFARELQVAHDYARARRSTAVSHLDLAAAKYNYLPLEVENNLRKLAAFHNLSIPE